MPIPIIKKYRLKKDYLYTMKGTGRVQMYAGDTFSYHPQVDMFIADKEYKVRNKSVYPQFKDKSMRTISIFEPIKPQL